MGLACCRPKTAAEVERDQVSAAIEAQGRADADKEARRIKLLLLGAGESGKPTVLKQMRLLYGTGYSDSQRLAMNGVVHANTIASMRLLINTVVELGITVDEEDARAAMALFEATADSSPITPAVGAAIATLWRSAAVQTAYAERARFQLPDSSRYYIERIDTLGAPDYVPSVEDVLRTRVRTTGIIEEEYTIGGSTFTIFDVGGQRNERRKWIHCFEDVTAIIFVAAISEYDQVLFEENTQNRLMEALTLFEYICGSRYFENTAIILFLNKNDIFAEKIKTVDLPQPNADPFKAEHEPVLFADYTGGCDYDKALAYILGRFLAKNKRPARQIYHQVTCATDTSNARRVLDFTKDVILQQNIVSSGLTD